MSKGSCKICKASTNDFISLNTETVPYSNIEISVSRKGMLRSRYFNDEGYMITQDIVNIKYCPLCGDNLVLYDVSCC